MAYLSKVRLPDGSEYDLKDLEARSSISQVRQVPASTSSDEGKVLGISNGSLGWVTPAVQQELRYSIADVPAGTSVTINGNTTVPYQLADRQVNVVTVDPGYTHVALVFPDGTSGYARDFFVRLVLTGSDVPDITFVDTSLNAVDMDVDDDSWQEIDLGVNLLMFTETSQPASQGE